jgi:hypothetical protein
MRRATQDSKTKDEEKRLEGLLKIVELRATDPTIEQTLLASGYRLNLGELFGSIINLTTDNDKILEELDPEELEGIQAEQMAQQQMEQEQMAQTGQPQEVTPEQAQMNVEAVMQEYGVDQETAAEMLILEEQGNSPEEIQAAFMQYQKDMQELGNA